MATLFDIDRICVTLLGYPLSYLEVLAVATGLVAVWLASRGKVANFYVGLANNVLYFLLFYQCRLYSMMLLQLIYFVISSYGIYSWSKRDEAAQTLKISRLNGRQIALIAAAIVLVGLLWSRVVLWLSTGFPATIEPPAYPMADALLTVASIAGQMLLTRKKLDNWLLWIVVNLFSIVLYVKVGIYFTVLLYVLYLAIAVQAYFAWRKEMKIELKVNS